MDEQLALIRDDAPDWRLDEHTRRLGLEGVERARSALRRSHDRDGPEPTGPTSPTSPTTPSTTRHAA